MMEAEAEIDKVRAALNVRDDVDAHHCLRFNAVEKTKKKVQESEWMLSHPCLESVALQQYPCQHTYCILLHTIPLLEYLFDCELLFKVYSLVPLILPTEESRTKVSPLAEMNQQDIPSPENIQS